MNDMIEDQTPRTPLQNRTRSAILEAATAVFVTDRSASLGEVAERAGVARSTLHRYFPERADLMAALRMYAKDRIAAAIEQARLDDGAAGDALLRLAVAYFEAWDTIMWEYMEAEAAGEHPEDDSDEVITALIDRGQAERSIDPEMPNAWIQHAMYAMVYSAWDYARAGHPRHEAAMMCETSLRKIMAPSPPDIVTPPTRKIIMPPST